MAPLKGRLLHFCAYKAGVKASCKTLCASICCFCFFGFFHQMDQT
uniref:Uncharacterized protein n=1 Tax=Anguilla anguilla TaxID=7936 RepID=A0A0E9VHL4_ANGAN